MKKTTPELARKTMIEEALKRKGMTQQDLAVLLDRGLRTIQSWLRSESIPELTPEETLELCDVFDCSVEELAQMFPGRSRRRAAIKRSIREKKQLV